MEQTTIYGDDFPREDGQPYATRIISERRCEWCGRTIPRRAKGRVRRFCNPKHRVYQARRKARERAA